jgi:hypothetical protein
MAKTKPACLRLPRQERRLRQACFKESYVQRCYPSSSFVQTNWDDDVESLLSLIAFMPPQFDLFMLCPCSSTSFQVDCNRSFLQSKLNETWIFY